jgi:hypothetical protein
MRDADKSEADKSAFYRNLFPALWRAIITLDDAANHNYNYHEGAFLLSDPRQ